MQYPAALSTVVFRYHTHDAEGALIAPSDLGAVTLVVNDVVQTGDEPTHANTTGIGTISIDLSDDALLTSGAWTTGDRIRAYITGMTVDGVEDIGGWIDDEATIGPLATAANLAVVDTVVDAIKLTTDKLDDTLEDDAGTYRFTTNALEQAPTGGSAPTAAQIADAVWDESTTGHTTSGTFGEQLKTDVDAILADTNELQADLTDGGRLDLLIDDLPTNAELATALDGLNDLSAAQVNAQVDAALADYDGPTNAEMIARTLVANEYATAANLATANSGIAATKAVTDKLDDTLEDDGGAYRFTANALEESPAAPTVGAVADAVWDEATTGHITAGTFGAQAKTVLDDVPTTAEFNARTLAAASYATATALAAVDAVVDAIQAVTDLLPDAGALSDLATLAARLSEVRAGYLDKLDVGGTLAHSGDADTYKADVSGLATSTDVSTAESNIRGGTETLESLNAAIGTRSSHSASDVKTAIEATGSQLEQLHNTLASDGVFSAPALANAPTGGSAPTVEEIADEVQTRTIAANVTEVAGAPVVGVNDFKADVSGLSTFDPATDVVARVTLVDTTTTNTDMRGTDGAYTGTPPTPPTVEAIANELEASDRFGGKFLTMVELDGAEYRFTENALEEGPGASLSGPYPLLVTVTDLATGDPIENARVRLYQSGVEESRDTNGSGQTQPALPALGTWGYAISAANHGSATGTVEIDGDPNPETLNVALAQTTTITPPADPDLCLGYFTAIGADGLPETGAVFYAKLVEGDGTAGYSLDTSTESATSASDGLVQFPGLLRGKRYVFWRGTSHSGAKPFTIPDQSTVAIPEFLGTP